MKYLGKHKKLYREGDTVTFGKYTYTVCHTLGVGWFLHNPTAMQNGKMFAEMHVNPTKWLNNHGIEPLVPGIFPYVSFKDLNMAIHFLKIEYNETVRKTKGQ